MKAASDRQVRPGDGVTVRSAPSGADLPDDTVELGDVQAPQTRADMRGGKAEAATMTCWTQASAPGTGEDAIEVARARAYQLLAMVEAALTADPTAGGTVSPPRGTTVADSGLVETLTDHNGSGGRRAQVRFTISWTSHLT